jgi:hypothetical protein
MILAFYSNGVLDFGALVGIEPQLASSQPVSVSALILMFNDLLGRRRHVECRRVDGEWVAHIVVESNQPTPEFPQQNAAITASQLGIVNVTDATPNSITLSYSFLPSLLGASEVDFSPLPERVEGVITLSRTA